MLLMWKPAFLLLETYSRLKVVVGKVQWWFAPDGQEVSFL
jgi:hypothetical protein